MGVGFNTIDIIDNGGIVTMNLIAWPRAEFENYATSGLYERGNNCSVFISNKVASYA